MSERKQYWTALKEFSGSQSFQIVVVPSVLVLIGLFFGDIQGAPVVAFWVTVCVALAGCALWFAVWKAKKHHAARHRSALADGTEVDRSFSGLVFAPSRLNPGGEERYRDLVIRIADSWKPTKVALVISHAVQESKGVEIVEKVLAEKRVTIVSTVRLLEAGHLEPTTILKKTKAAIDSLGDPADVLVDITAGTSVMSVGLYEAAMETDANVGYIEMVEERKAPRLILESAPVADES
ncbi:MAG: hypothetical protein JST64_11920 [Actinobacteria bacterium]|nr:hypothetical protein [Actinomycetota bacterium]